MPTMTLGKALNAGLRQAMEDDDKVVLMGEDIGKLGGVFRVTEGLQEQFGERRVIDTPLAESGVIGTAVGLAMRGYRPVCEIQFDGFVYPAFDQIVSQVAKFRFRNEGRVAMPITIRIPYGGGIGAVEHHSESPEAYFAHTAGLRVVTPSNAADGHRMIRQAIASDDPVIFFEPKRRYWEKGDVDDGLARGEDALYRARVAREGTDVTVAAYGPMVATTLDAAAMGADEGTSIEVLDLRSLSPVDFETIEASVRKTGRLVVVHEAPVFAGLGAEIAARVQERCFYHLESPVLRVGGFATPYPASKLERYFLPDADRILHAVDRAPRFVSDVRRFLLPDLGEGLTEGEVVAWHVAAGDVVTLNQVLVEVETEKAVVELPSPFAGTVVELFAAPGETVAVGAPLIAVETAVDAAAPAPAGEPEKVSVLVGYGPSAAARSRRRRNGRAHRSGPPDPVTSGDGPSRPLAAPPVRYMARQHGVDLADVAGHGPDGIITRDDLAAHLAAAVPSAPSVAAAGRETRTPVRGVQKHMAEAMVRSVTTAPQACVFLTADVTPTMELLERLRQNRHLEGLRVTLLAVVVRAVLHALADHPELNSSWDEGTREVVTKHYVNLGIAVAGPHGLVVPNIKDAQELSLRELVRALADLTEKARDAKSTPADLSDGTITITNVGVFGVDSGVPILNPGEAAILAFGAVQRRPWEHEGEIALRQVATLSLSFDHRLVDGRGASLFLAGVAEILADPTHLVALS